MEDAGMVQMESPGQPQKGIDYTLVVVRGGGDIASGSIARLFNAGFRVVVLETAQPTVIRGAVSFAQAVYEGSVIIDGIEAVSAEDHQDINRILERGAVPVVVDPKGKIISVLKPFAVVDGILAKENLGTDRNMAPIVIGLGPGFEAGKDVDAVIETNRGHNLGRVIMKGKPEPNTGVPGIIGGEADKRVVRASAAGRVKVKKKIGDMVKTGDLIAVIEGNEVRSQLNGVLRGIIHDGMEVPLGFKIGDVDPRGIVENCFTISDKARAVGGGTLEAILALKRINKRK